MDEISAFSPRFPRCVLGDHRNPFRGKPIACHYDNRHLLRQRCLGFHLLFSFRGTRCILFFIRARVFRMANEVREDFFSPLSRQVCESRRILSICFPSHMEYFSHNFAFAFVGFPDLRSVFPLES